MDELYFGWMFGFVAILAVLAVHLMHRQQIREEREQHAAERDRLSNACGELIHQVMHTLYTADRLLQHYDEETKNPTSWTEASEGLRSWVGRREAGSTISSEEMIEWSGFIARRIRPAMEQIEHALLIKTTALRESIETLLKIAYRLEESRELELHGTRRAARSARRIAVERLIPVGAVVFKDCKNTEALLRFLQEHGSHKSLRPVVEDHLKTLTADHSAWHDALLKFVFVRRSPVSTQEAGSD